MVLWRFSQKKTIFKFSKRVIRTIGKRHLWNHPSTTPFQKFTHIKLRHPLLFWWNARSLAKKCVCVYFVLKGFLDELSATTSRKDTSSGCWDHALALSSSAADVTCSENLCIEHGHTRRTILKTYTYSSHSHWNLRGRALDDGANADFGPTLDVTHCVAFWDTLAVGC